MPPRPTTPCRRNRPATRGISISLSFMSVERMARGGVRGGWHAQQGALLLEFMVVAILSLVLAVWTGGEWAQRARALQARSLAAWMEIARDAADAFLARHAHELAIAPA